METRPNAPTTPLPLYPNGERYKSLRDFYPFYLQEHTNATSRRLHFIGTGLIIPIFFYALFTQTWWMLVLVPVVGYGFAWAGHAFFEKNKPATFVYPLYSLASDFVMFKDIIVGRVKW